MAYFAAAIKLVVRTKKSQGFNLGPKNETTTKNKLIYISSRTNTSTLPDTFNSFSESLLSSTV
ncbi:hypothetical protein HME9304_02172 [Flagellimonas maritima]|uniref:Uncharacterized protein n=1 Tax=Flagellimonas maritima TaxID=1383885 RepID=A0A2Z4LTU5_9FLAO|nr:hypothetical protein HME9304_02172 [Allomuricauda aurantiaca]